MDVSFKQFVVSMSFAVIVYRPLGLLVESQVKAKFLVSMLFMYSTEIIFVSFTQQLFIVIFKIKLR